MNGFQIKIVNAEHRVATSTIEKLPDAYSELMKGCGHSPEEFVILRMKERDWLVLNEQHPCFEQYKELCLAYMVLGQEDREKVLSETPNDTTCRFLLTIESVIRDRDGMNSEGTENMKGQMEHQKELDYAGTYKRI